MSWFEKQPVGMPNANWVLYKRSVERELNREHSGLSEMMYLAAIVHLGTRYHSGQWSKGYRLQCLAEKRMYREFSVSAYVILRCAGLVETDDKTSYRYRKHTQPRKLLAFWLKRLRHSRRSL